MSDWSFSDLLFLCGGLTRSAGAWSRRTCDQAPANRVQRQHKDNRDDRCRLLCRWNRDTSRNNDIDVEPNELGRDLGVALGAALRPAILDRDGATLDPTEFAQACHKSSRPWTKG